MPKIVADEMVFDAIIETITKHGYSGATTKMIAELAQINEATLFRKYGSKDQMVLKAMQHLFEKTDTESMANYTGDIRADLLHLLDTFFEVEDTNGAIFMILAAEMQHHPELRQAAHIPINVLFKVGQLFARYQADGVLRQEHPFQAVISFMAPIVVCRRLQTAGVQPSLLEIDRVSHVDGYLNGRMLSNM